MEVTFWIENKSSIFNIDFDIFHLLGKGQPSLNKFYFEKVSSFHIFNTKKSSGAHCSLSKYSIWVFVCVCWFGNSRMKVDHGNMAWPATILYMLLCRSYLPVCNKLPKSGWEISWKGLIKLSCIVLYCIMLYCKRTVHVTVMKLCCIVLYCIMLYCPCYSDENCNS